MHPSSMHPVILLLAGCSLLFSLPISFKMHNVVQTSIKDSVQRERYLSRAEDLDAAGIRAYLQEPNADPNTNDCKGGALFRILNRSTESEMMLECLQAVLEHKDANPNEAGNIWPPLKIALARGHRVAAQLLLNHPKTKREMDPAGLSCEVIAQFPNEVLLSYDTNAPQCMCMIHNTFGNIVEGLRHYVFGNFAKHREEIQIPKAILPNVLHARYLAAADGLDATGIRAYLLKSDADPNANHCKGGALFRILNRSTESEQMLECLRAVLRHKDANPNEAGNTWPPLKIALARGHRVAAQLLLNHPKTKKEMDPAGLNCAVIAQIPNEVRLSYDPQCVCMIPTPFDIILDSMRTFLSGGWLNRILDPLRYLLFDCLNNILDPLRSLVLDCLNRILDPLRYLLSLCGNWLKEFLDAVRYYFFLFCLSGMMIAFVGIGSLISEEPLNFWNIFRRNKRVEEPPNFWNMFRRNKRVEEPPNFWNIFRRNTRVSRRVVVILE